MKVTVITLFPELVNAVVESGITGRASKRGLVSLSCWNPRDFTDDKHRKVDDRPFGGGPGMVMMAEPLIAAITAAKQQHEGDTKVLVASPQGKPLSQSTINALAQRKNMVLIAGRYEGIDERVIDGYVDEEFSLGDYVLSGGELAAMVLIDAVVRQLPGALGHELSAAQDSFSEGLLDCPHYTRPECVAGSEVPLVLLSGNHAEIARWRTKQALGRTWQRRPELLATLELSEDQQKLLREFKDELSIS